jgi:exopolysaccharide production protein ExoZ
MVYNIQALRGLAALMVVLIHLLSTHPSVSIGKPHMLYGWIGPIGVDIFFVISGFVVSLSAYSTYKNNKSVATFFLKRLIRVYPLYWIVFITASIFSSYLYLSPEWLPKESNFNLFFLFKETNYKVMVAWTLHYELYFYLTLSIILMFGPKSFWKACTLIAISQLIIFIITSNQIYSGYANLLFSSGLLVDFSMGGLICFLYLKDKIYYPYFFTILGVIFFSASIISHANFADVPWSANWRLLFGVSSALTIYGIIGLEKLNIVFSKKLQSIGDYSYSLYIWHQFIFAFLFFTSKKLQIIPDDRVLLTLLLFLWLSIAMVLAKVSYLFIERPIVNFANAYFDNRNVNKNGKKLLSD